jgi:hypothetical protein
MKNVTIALDDETHRRARIRAAELGTSLSALVKSYLIDLSDDGVAPERQIGGVREMPMPFHHEPPPPTVSAVTPVLQASPPAAKGPDGQPYYVAGKWVWTKDGKPRKPGAMRHLAGWTKDFDEWPDGFIDAMYGNDTEAANNWWKPLAKAAERPGSK